ncbi:multicopper oxidase domain-containing protein [Streptomyces luteogriseus]|uniref:multicopper oxidase domain-containing protein n=1 Tax=Streptomyces luteogriseus TaxID=68233 RepID=UPI0037FE5454
MDIRLHARQAGRLYSINRRSVLLGGLGVAGAGALAACSSGSSATPTLVNHSGSAVAATEKKRKGTGRTQKVTLSAAPAMLDLGGGVMARSWAFSGQAPGKEIRLSVGETPAAELTNHLPNKTATSIHWHGIAMRNTRRATAMVVRIAGLADRRSAAVLPSCFGHSDSWNCGCLLL